MFAKLVVVVLTIGACACTLLSIRQARLQAAHELARAQLRVRECDDRLWAVRAEIGRRVVPDHVRQMADALGSFRPMLPLPGDLDRRTMYAQNPQPPSDPAAPVNVDQSRPTKSSQPTVRTVSQTQTTKSKPKVKPDAKADSKAKTPPKPKPARHANATRRESGT